jgi:hypothetical protein
VKGEIISWMYDDQLRCYAIKREFGVQYLKSPSDFSSLPYWDVRELARRPFINNGNYQMASWFENLVKFESRTKFKHLKPQKPERFRSKSKIHPITKKPLVILKCKAPKVLKKVPLKKMEQNFGKNLKWWYYDNATGEAVIVLKDNRVIRVFDPMWLINLSEEDIRCLYYNQILFNTEDIEQALQFQRVIRICFAFNIHAGDNARKKWSSG